MWNGVPTFGHSSGDGLAQRRERLFRDRTPFGKVDLLDGRLRGLWLAGFRARRLFSGNSGLKFLNIGAQIRHYDTSTGFAPSDAVEIYPQFACEFSDGGRSGGSSAWLGLSRRRVSLWFRLLLFGWSFFLFGSLRFFSRLGSFSLRRGARFCGFLLFGARVLSQREKLLSDADFIAGFDEHFANCACGSGWNRGHRLLIF